MDHQCIQEDVCLSLLDKEFFFFNNCVYYVQLQRICFLEECSLSLVLGPFETAKGRFWPLAHNF